jgi:hypothetical protein
MSIKTIPEKPRTFHGNLEQLPAALLPLTNHRRWVIWKWEYVENKKDGDAYWTKVPYQPRYYNETAKSNDTKTWGTYAEAIIAYAAGHCDGIGYMLKGAELGAIDLDHIRSLATGTGEVLRWAEGLFAEAAEAGCYLEWTVSGTGARIIGIARDSELHKKINVHAANKCAVEFYRDCNRFITISGMQIGDYPGLPKTTELPVYDTLFDELYARFSDEKTRPTPEACEFAGGVHIAIEEIKDDEAPNNEYDLNDAGEQEPSIQALIEKGAPVGKRSEKFQQVVWHLAAQGLSPEQIAEVLAKHPAGIGQKYAGRLPAEVARSLGKWQAKQQAGTTGNPAPAPLPGAPSKRPTTPWPLIRIKSGELPRVVREAERALILLGDEIYQRAGMLMRPVLNESVKASGGRQTSSWQLIEVVRPYLVEVLCRAAQFERCKVLKNGFVEWYRVDAPDKIAETYLKHRGRWTLPHLAGVVNTPFLRVDGSICEVPGYDAASRLLFKPEGEVFPAIPQSPGKADALAALKKLKDLISTFPFEDKPDRSVALAGMLTALDRRAMSTAPLFAYTAPAAGTGKSLLADIASVLAIGRVMPVIAQGRTEEEFEKRLGATLLAGDVCISVDNCEAPLSGTLLCQALTQTEVDIRVLGLSKNVRCATNITIFATGNNLVIAGDLTRRCLLSSLDAGVERPELREFAIDVVEEAGKRRAELVVAGLTILRAWQVARAGGERVKVAPFGSFAGWSHRIREALVWLGEKDPCDTIKKVRENDPQRNLLEMVVTQWRQILGTTKAFTAQEVIALAMNVQDFYAALTAVAPAPRGGIISAIALGRYLKRVQGKIVSGYAVLEAGIHNGYRKYQVVKR